MGAYDATVEVKAAVSATHSDDCSARTAEASVNSWEELIKRQALQRLSEIFHTPIENIKPESRFGVDLKAKFFSDFKRNELDQVNGDIHEVADRKTLKQLGTGELMIGTARDYCDHMVRSSKGCNRAEVISILGIRDHD